MDADVYGPNVPMMLGTGYGQPDVEFARRLRAALTNRGVTCWLYDLDGTPGERTQREITHERQAAAKS